MSELKTREEYLKRYQDVPKKTKKIKPKSYHHQPRFKIIDEDIDLKKIEVSNDDDIEVGEEAPLVVGLIDERPIHEKIKENYSCKLWRKLGSPVSGQEPSSSKYSELEDNLSDKVAHLLKEQVKDECHSRKTVKTSLNKHKIKSVHSSDINSSPSKKSSEEMLVSNSSGRSSEFIRNCERNNNFSPSRRTSELLHEKQDDFTSHGKAVKRRHDSDNDLSPPRRETVASSTAVRKSYDNRSKMTMQCGTDSDISPPRTRTRNSRVSDSDSSPPRLRKHDMSENDLSPPRIRKHDMSDSGSPPPRKRQHDLSPPRTRKRYTSDSDLSPPRGRVGKHHRHKNHHSSHKRKRKYSPESSSESCRKKSKSKVQKNSHSCTSSSQQKATSGSGDKKSDPKDEIPTKEHTKYYGRNRSSHHSLSLPEKPHSEKRRRNDSDDESSSPERHHAEKQHDSDGNRSLSEKYGGERRRQHNFTKDGQQDSPCKQRINSSHSRSSDSSMHKGKSRGKVEKRHTSGSSDLQRDLQFSIMCGTTTGFQDSASLQGEMQNPKLREQTAISRVSSDELSGHNAETVVGAKDVGRRQDLKEKKNAEKQEKYFEWGKGLKQQDEQCKKYQQDLYEMSKPLARYIDDDDLENALKNKLRKGDPMLEYAKMKRRDNQPVAYEMPVYQGPPAPPNRFSIPPGYRWDGVDRSNGFEKKFFEKGNSTKATEYEAYLWSVQNM